MMQRITFFILMLSTFFACNSTSTRDAPNAHYYKFVHRNGSGGDYFVAKTTDPNIIEQVDKQLDKPLNERNLFIIGDIARGKKDYNSQWNWYFIAGEWEMAETSVEVCDGLPQMVEENLEYWVDQVGHFCPWSYRVGQKVTPNQL